MKAKTLQISWHTGQASEKNDPIFSLDFHPTLDPPVLATAGSDSEVKIWRMTRTEDGGYSAEYLYSFTCHSAPVNVVRWSPNGEILASAGDDRTIVILRPQPGMTWASVTLERDTVRSFLRGHHADVYDLSWSPDSSCLISGSVDRTAIMWDVAASKQMQILKDHTNFVQGVAWDPLDKFVATQGCDRSCRLYSRSSRKAGTAFKTVPITVRSFGDAASGSAAEASPAALPSAPPASGSPSGTPSDAAAAAGDTHATPLKRRKLYVDETMPSFFRRLCWSPDGSLLLTPAGLAAPAVPASSPGVVAPAAEAVPATHVFAREAWGMPCMSLPSVDETAPVAIRCCPALFTLRRDPESATVKLPHRVVFAVATLGSVAIYDTEQRFPIAVVANLHLDKLTDLAWAPRGKLIIVSSIDGYCSVIALDDAELGDMIAPAVVPEPLPVCAAAAPAAIEDSSVICADEVVAEVAVTAADVTTTA